jgi:hypothetical protein
MLKLSKSRILWLVLILVGTLVIFFACSNKNTYQVTFETNGASEIESIEYKNGDQVILPLNITKEGYTFVVW